MRNNANGLIGFCLQLFERTDGSFQHFGIQCPESLIDKQAFDQYVTGGKIRETKRKRKTDDKCFSTGNAKMPTWTNSELHKIYRFKADFIVESTFGEAFIKN